MRLFLLALMILLMCAAARGSGREGGERRAAANATGPVVSRELALWRAAHYRNVRYALDLLLEPGAEMLKGTVTISVAIDNPSEDLVLDWRVVKRDANPRERVSQITINGKDIKDARFADDHILIPAPHLARGENVLRLAFASPVSTSGSAVTRYRDREDNSEYVYTLFVPSDASTAFPCFDQPDLKARFQLTITAPETWKVITNTDAHYLNVGLYDLNERRRTTPPTGMSTTIFQETAPLSTYHFAFAAGPFEEFNEAAAIPSEKATAYPPLKDAQGSQKLMKLVENAGTRIRLFVRKSKAERARKELPEVFRLNREGLKFFEGYFAHKFPFPKYDLVVIPEFAYNGMEHAGATFLREEGVIFPSDPTSTDFAIRAELLLHEAAHQWFGDLVTMRWFDDLWLKEGFATFMAYKAIDELMPEQDAWKVFHLRTKPLAYLTDVTKGTTPIWQEIPNLSAAKSAYGNIVYRKAPAMLRQAEFYLGADEFRRAVRLVVKEHAYANAEWADLVRAFERTSGRKLTAWADAWVKRRGMADVRVNWSADRRGRINRFTVEQKDVLGEGGAWPMKVEIGLTYSDTHRALTYNVPVVLQGLGVAKVDGVLGRDSPAYVFANYDDYGYGRFLLDEKSRAYLLRQQSWGDGLNDTLILSSLWESVREAELAPLDYIETGMSFIASERDDVTLQAVLSRVQVAFTRYLSDEQKNEVAPRLERAVFERMMNAETAGQRIVYFRTYREIATTREASDRLVKILSGETKVPGMTLRARDRFDLIRALVAGGDARASALLKKQGDEDKSDDGRRYAFAAAAAEPSDADKKNYFERFTRDPELAESWIEAAFGPFNSPRHSALTLPHLDAALRELPTLKRTRKIFFVNGWLAAFLGGQCSPRALEVVNDFLRRETALDRDLRLKVLEASDGLERCVRIRAKYADATKDASRPAS